MFMGGVPFNCSQIVKMKLIITTIFVCFLLSHTPFSVMFAYNLKVLNMFHALFLLLYYFSIIDLIVVMCH